MEVRDRLLRMEPDCLAVPLPPSFQEEVEAGILDLPSISIVAAEEPLAEEPLAEDPFADEPPAQEPSLGEPPAQESEYGGEPWEGDDTFGHGEPAGAAAPACNFVPIDPCQPVIAALRAAMEERIPRAFVDLETEVFEPYTAVLPDPYALKKVSLDAFAASLLTAAPPPRPMGQREARIRRSVSNVLPR